jgi:NAD(P)-dependent dehydrogenase (short-subunit alcohol dehydrogenase family)
MPKDLNGDKMITFDGKVAVLTGAGSGIGQACAALLAERGASVVVCDIDSRRGNATVEAIKRDGGDAVFESADVSNASQVEAMFQRIQVNYGRLDIAVNNAGMGGVPALTSQCTERDWDYETGVMFKGVWLCCRSELAIMQAQSGGSIVNIASVAGLVGYEGVSPTLSACKFGVIGITKTAALEYAKCGIRVNAVCPGTTLTPQLTQLFSNKPEIRRSQELLHPMGRLADPMEIAEAVVWLASPMASFVTGHSLVVDGGYTAQ